MKTLVPTRLFTLSFLLFLVKCEPASRASLASWPQPATAFSIKNASQETDTCGGNFGPLSHNHRISGDKLAFRSQYLQYISLLQDRKFLYFLSNIIQIFVIAPFKSCYKDRKNF